MATKRKVIIGLDGMPTRLMSRFAADGTMPHFGALVEGGVFSQMASSIPEVSSVAWSSIITGKNPGEHGVYGFTDIAPNTYRTTFPNFSTLKAPPFWDWPNSGRSAIINVPTTFPAQEMNGVLIAGFVALDLERAVYPPPLVPILQEMDYRVDVDSQKGHVSAYAFLADLDKTLKARIQAYRHLWDQEDWDLFMLVFTGVDRLGHFMWDAYENPDHPHRAEFIDHFRQIDAVIGEIAGQLNSGDSIVMVSDHGFELIDREIYPNFLLQQEGYLSFENGAKPGLKSLSDKARAFVLDPGRIYLNTVDRFPRGSVGQADCEALLSELTDLFMGLTVVGKPAIKQVFRREELYHGPQAANSPDLVLLGHSGFNLRGNFRAKELSDKGVFVGKHSQADAFLLVAGDFDPDIIPAAPTVCDVAGIIERL